MKRIWCPLLTLAMVLAVVLSACAAPKAPSAMPAPAPQGPAAGSPAPARAALTGREQLLEAAKKEGEVALWANTFGKAQDTVTKTFGEKYPFIKIKFWDASTADDVMNKLVEEGKAGRVTGDIFFATEGDMVSAITLGLLQEYDWKTAGWPNQPSHKFFINYGSNPRLSAFNTNIIPVEQGPKSWEDLALPKWRDKSPVSSFSGADISLLMAYLWREDGKLNWEKSEKYLTDVVKNNRPKVVRGFTGAIEMMVAGEYGIFIPIASGRMLMQFAMMGAPIAIVPVGKTTGNSLSVTMVKNAAHPNAAKVFADWFAAEGGQLSVIQENLTYAIDPQTAKVARGNQLLAGKYKIEVEPTPTEFYAPENVKRASDFWLKLLDVK